MLEKWCLGCWSVKVASAFSSEEGVIIEDGGSTSVERWRSCYSFRRASARFRCLIILISLGVRTPVDTPSSTTFGGFRVGGETGFCWTSGETLRNSACLCGLKTMSTVGLSALSSATVSTGVGKATSSWGMKKIELTTKRNPQVIEIKMEEYLKDHVRWRNCRSPLWITRGKNLLEVILDCMAQSRRSHLW